MKKLLKILSGVLLLASIPTAYSFSAGAVPAAARSTQNSTSSELGRIAIGIIIAVFAVIIFILILSAIIHKYKQAKPHGSSNEKSLKESLPRNQILLPVSDIVPPNYNEIIAAEIRRHDPDFSSVKFCDWSKNVFTRLLTSLSNNDLREMRLLTTEQLQKKLNAELQGMISGGNINVFHQIRINRCYLQLLVQNQLSEKVTVYVSGTMQYYMAAYSTMTPLPYYRTDSQPFKYLLTFCRKKTATTIYINGIQAVCCHNCGAPTENASDVKCSYCGSLLTPADDNWLLSDVVAMQDNRPLDDRGIALEDL